MLNKLIYCFKTAFKNIQKNIMLNIIVSTTIAITFIIFVSFLILIMNFSSFKKNWVDQIQVVVYFKDVTPPDFMQTIKTSIQGLAEVESVKLVSRDEALIMLKDFLQGQDGILDGLSGNPLSASLEIKLKDEFLNTETMDSFINKIKTSEYIDDIEYGQKWLERFVSLFDVIKITGSVFGSLLFLFTLFIISNTIKLMIYNRRDEVEIMKLVGATNRFIKLPFCIEGVVQGLIGSSCALIVLFFVATIFMDRVISFIRLYIGTYTFVFLDFRLTTYILLLGALLGLMGSLFALQSIEEFEN